MRTLVVHFTLKITILIYFLHNYKLFPMQTVVKANICLIYPLLIHSAIPMWYSLSLKKLPLSLLPASLYDFSSKQWEQNHHSVQTPTVYLQIKCGFVSEYITCCCLGNWFWKHYTLQQLTYQQCQQNWRNLKARVL